MKKILSSVLCLAMLLSLGVTAFAETNDFVLTYANEASYEITIPASGDVDSSTGKGTITITVDNANLAENTAVSVTATSANYADGYWYLVNTRDATDKIAYTIGTTDGGSNIASGSSVLSADSDTSTTLYVTVSDTSKVGTFTDTITFTSEIVETVNLITFTISGTSYQAIDGMAWDEWIDSQYNTDGYYISLERVCDKTSKYVTYDGTAFSNHIIIEGANYYLSDGVEIGGEPT